MKKIISPFVLLLSLLWTWNVIHSSVGVSFETHSSLQQQLAELIEKTLTEKKPQMIQIKINRLWTESISNNKIRAYFTYSFTEKISEPTDTSELIEQTVEGVAELYKVPSQNPNEENSWVLQSVKNTMGTLLFSEGSIVTPENILPENTEN